MTVVTAWTVIACTLLLCLTATTIAGLIVGNRKPKPEEQFTLRDIPKPKTRKLD
jgi:hypothetical protein